MDHNYASAGLLWFFIMCANSAIAGALGRLRLGTFLLSILIGPLVTLYLAFAGRREDS